MAEKIGEYEIHPLALLAPKMRPDEYAGLMDSIRKQGLTHPVVLYEGKLLDGRHRARACLQLGIPIKTEEFTGNTEAAVNRLMAEHLDRRHMSPSQRALYATDLKTRIRKEARARMLAGKKADEPYGKSTIGSEKGSARDIAAALVKVSGKMVDLAEHVKEAAPDLIPKLRDGDLTLNAATRVIQARKDMTSGVYPELAAHVKAGIDTFAKAQRKLLTADGKGVEDAQLGDFPVPKILARVAPDLAQEVIDGTRAPSSAENEIRRRFGEFPKPFRYRDSGKLAPYRKGSREKTKTRMEMGVMKALAEVESALALMANYVFRQKRNLWRGNSRAAFVTQLKALSAKMAQMAKEAEDDCNNLNEPQTGQGKDHAEAGA